MFVWDWNGIGRPSKRTSVDGSSIRSAQPKGTDCYKSDSYVYILIILTLILKEVFFHSRKGDLNEKEWGQSKNSEHITAHFEMKTISKYRY